MHQALLYRLTLDASPDWRRVRSRSVRLCVGFAHPPSQLYRLLDPTNSRKSVDRMLGLLRVLGCDVDVVVRLRVA